MSAGTAYSAHRTAYSENRSRGGGGPRGIEFQLDRSVVSPAPRPGGGSVAHCTGSLGHPRYEDTW